jgi:undecaprenyl-diphosphatase
MRTLRDSPPLSGIVTFDLWLCTRLNRIRRRWLSERLLAGVDRLGNGPFWYGLFVALPLLAGPAALAVVARMLGAGVVSLAVYRWLKARTGRPRPCAAHAEVVARAEPRDPYSFPSGHTLHAVAFTTIAVAHYPGLAWVLVPFAALTAWSRVALGLHYPTDVVAGALLGAAIGALALLAA